MHSIVASGVIISFVICCITITISPLNAFPNKNETELCPQFNDCFSCIGEKGCALWYCILPNGDLSDDLFCENTSSSKPKEICPGKWHKLQSHDTCDSINSTVPDPKAANKKHSMSYAKSLINDGCSELKDCDTCFGDRKCAFWWCDVDDVWSGAMVCDHPADKAPSTPCEGKWSKLERPHNCTDVHKKNTTTTTTTTQSPETTTDKNTTTTTTPKSTTSVPFTTTNGPDPHPQTEGKLTGWTIAGITISSVVVILILVGVSYKKVMKIYRARNPYRTLNE